MRTDHNENNSRLFNFVRQQGGKSVSGLLLLDVAEDGCLTIFFDECRVEVLNCGLSIGLTVAQEDARFLWRQRIPSLIRATGCDSS